MGQFYYPCKQRSAITHNRGESPSEIPPTYGEPHEMFFYRLYGPQHFLHLQRALEEHNGAQAETSMGK